MKSVLIGIFVSGTLGGGLVAGWVAMNMYWPGEAGTPAHAGIVSNGQVEDCVSLNFNVRPRASVERTALFEKGDLVRGTFEAHGGLGHVDILLRIRDPQRQEIYASQRTDTEDFTFPAAIAGEYTFVFDNRYSLYTSKAIGLFYCADPGRAPVPTPFGPVPPGP
jgi:hypothetical protein